MAVTALLVAGCNTAERDDSAPAQAPNVILVLADDLGYGDLGSYGQQRILTPTLDRLAAEGVRFTQFYAGATVCAPSRSVIMTGLHGGHTRVRGNGGPDKQTLRDEDVTIAERLQQSGYRTGLIGKWGLGDVGNEGRPNDQGFDYFFGYLNQVHAHNYYPEFLWRDTSRVLLNNEVVRADRPYGGFTGGAATKRSDYSHDLLVDDAVQFVSASDDGPFFLYLALTIPHANNESHLVDRHGQEVPSYGVYADSTWPAVQKGTAAMITRMDAGLDAVIRAAESSNPDRPTVVLFSSDNGPHAEGGNDADFFDSNGPLRGIKRALYDGGIRVPMIAWSPELFGGGRESNHVGHFADIFPTLESLAGLTVTDSLDGISLVPELVGRREGQQRHDYLYWEFYERGSAQAVRRGDWKAVRKPMFDGATELYDLRNDPGEQDNLADDHPDVVIELEQLMDEAHRPEPGWTIGG